MEKKGLIIAVDGYSSTGKSTVSKILAARLGYTYIDTGAMYRMVTYRAISEDILSVDGVDDKRLKEELQRIVFGFKYNREKNRYESYLNGVYVEDAIRRMDVSDSVSLIAAIPYVREVLVRKQREMAEEGGVVMDGRDIGSVVFPHAEVKFFMTAAPEIRAQRRYKELVEKGEKVTYEEVEENVRKRDYIDENREVSPLRRTPDAIVIDNGEMSIEEEVAEMLKVIKSKYEGRD
ncbi:(d)CMP kinase [Gabonibacter chumensis]|uniref:(d)CMP kinase n=1 Tax=Gabonibacter chumensis TaxID=2972474 RepID=UPI002573BA27|nr:(d)CMP kinase [Gabonibacter chumensis]MCR9013181.1 (d)CMP kinase [Gabonibacter chumensis]